MNHGIRLNRAFICLSLLIMCIFWLAACQNKLTEEKSNPTTATNPSSQTQLALSPEKTSTPEITTATEPASTIQFFTPSPTVVFNQPGLGVKQEDFMNLFRMKGFNFIPPLGFLTWSKEQGHPYDMNFQVSFSGSVENLQRMEMTICTYPPVKKEQLELMADYLHLFHSTILPYWQDGYKWLDTNLPILNTEGLNKASTQIYEVHAQLAIDLWLSVDNTDGVCYRNTFWVDPISSGVGEQVHISIEFLNRLKSDDQILLSCSDFEDPASATWATSYSCAQVCDTDHPNVKVAKSKITVYEGFPVTHDQWSVKIITGWDSRYKENELIISLVYHDEIYTCTNNVGLDFQNELYLIVDGVNQIEADPRLNCAKQ